jgi:hypothetical protein
MKNLYFLLIALVITATVSAQSDRFYYPDAFYIVKEVKVEGLKERPYHFELSVKENPADTLSKPRIYAIQVRKGKEDLIGKTMVYASSASNKDWKTYSIDGIIDNEATRIWLYIAVNGNGEFYFDNLQCSIADVNGTLQEKDLSNPSFEEKRLLNGYYVSDKPGKNLQIQSSPIALDGKQSLLVTTAAQKPGSTRILAKN